MLHSIESAGRWIKEKLAKGLRKTVKEDKQIKDFQPSIAPEEDQKKYILYCASLLEDVPSEIMKEIPRELRQVNTLSSKQLAMFMRQFITKMITFNLSYKTMAIIYHVPEKVIERFNILCNLAVKEAIEITKREKVPILGG